MSTLRLVVAFVLLDAATAAAQASAPSDERRIAVGIIEPSGWKPDSLHAGSVRGLTLGTEEAVQTARLFGWEVIVIHPPDSLTTDAALAFLTRAGINAIVGDLSDVRSQYPRPRSAPVILDIGRMHGVDRRCADGRFYLLPFPDSPGAGTPKLAWHPSLERFGAGELNERYRRRFGAEMDELAWAGWMSMKILIDATLRRGTARPGELEAFLVKTARFDGHKGTPLYFDPDLRVLVQPMFSLRPAGDVEEVTQVEPQLRSAAGSISRCQPS